MRRSVQLSRRSRAERARTLQRVPREVRYAESSWIHRSCSRCNHCGSCITSRCVSRARACRRRRDRLAEERARCARSIRVAANVVTGRARNRSLRNRARAPSRERRDWQRPVAAFLVTRCVASRDFGRFAVTRLRNDYDQLRHFSRPICGPNFDRKDPAARRCKRPYRTICCSAAKVMLQCSRTA